MNGTFDPSYIASLELSDFESLTKFQRDQYYPDKYIKAYEEGIDYDYNQEDELILSTFALTIRKISLCTDILSKMEVISGNSGEYKYLFNKKMHYWLYSYLIDIYPEAKLIPEVKDLVEIAWVHNLAHNRINYFNFLIDDRVVQTITNTWLDIFAQYFITNDKRELYRKNIGDFEYNGGWGNSLKSIKTKLPLPFFNQFERSHALPMFLCSLSKIECKASFRTSLTQLIKMRKRNTADSDWKECKVVPNVIQNPDKILSPPEMWSYYSAITKSEVDWFKEMTVSTDIQNNISNNQDIKPVKNGPRQMYINDIITISPDILYSSVAGQTNTAIIPLNSFGITKAIFWVLQNQDGLIYNNYSNYTTNSLNIKEGSNPVEKVSLKYGEIKRLDTVDICHFEDMVSYYRFPSNPFEKGYSVYSFSPNSIDQNCDIGIVFNDNKANLILNLAENIDDSYNYNIEVSDESLSPLQKYFKSKKSSKKISKPKYKAYVFLMIMKKLSFQDNEKVKIDDGNEKAKYE